MSMSMSQMGNQGGLMRELEALEEIDDLRGEKAALEVVCKQMATELDRERPSTAAGPAAAGAGAGSPGVPVVTQSEVLLLRRQLQEEKVARRAAAREARRREEALQHRVEELEGMLTDALTDVTQAMDASAMGLMGTSSDQLEGPWGDDEGVASMCGSSSMGCGMDAREGWEGGTET